MPPASIPDNELQRLASLMSCDVLDTGPEARFDELTALAARLCQAPTALVSLVDCDRQWFKSRVGMPAEQTPRDVAFCAHAILGRETMVIPDATADARTADNALVTGEPHIRAYAGVPLCLSDGQAVGTLCVLDYRPRDFDAGQLRDLESLARQVVSQLELNRSNQQLTRYAQAADHANRAKTSFVSSLSHEIRTPLTAILGYVELLAQREELEETPIDRDEVVEVIHRNSRDLLTLVNDLLDLSRIEAGRMTLDREPTDLCLLIEEVFTTVRPVAKGKGLSLASSLHDVPGWLMLDPARTRQVLLNLVSNAVKFTSAGGIHVHAEYTPGTGGLRLEVRDTGVGMTREQLARVRMFQPFVQAERHTQRSFGGTGLGLSISHHLLALMDATLDVESTYGSGTTFYIRLTAEAAEDPEGYFATPQQLASPLGDTPLAGLRVLLAEDGTDNQRLIRHHLVAAGAAVEVVSDGAAACDAVTKASPGMGLDLVLMDMQMPVMDGYEATAKLRSRGCRLPILALTASASAEDIDRCLRSGCDAHLAKPYGREELIRLCVRYAEASAFGDAQGVA